MRVRLGHTAAAVLAAAAAFAYVGDVAPALGTPRWLGPTLLATFLLWLMFGAPAQARLEAADPRYAEDKAALCPPCRSRVDAAEGRWLGLLPVVWPVLCPRDHALMDAWCVLDPAKPRPTPPPLNTEETW